MNYRSFLNTRRRQRATTLKLFSSLLSTLFPRKNPVRSSATPKVLTVKTSTTPKRRSGKSVVQKTRSRTEKIVGRHLPGLRLDKRRTPSRKAAADILRYYRAEKGKR